MPERLNPKALGLLYKAAKSIFNLGCCPTSLRLLREAINFAESPAEQPTSGVMTIEVALEFAKCYACLGLDTLTNLKPVDLAKEFVHSDRNARREELASGKQVILPDEAEGDTVAWIERRLEELK